MKVLIAGAGYVGRAAFRLLEERGHQPYGLRRSKIDDPAYFVGDASSGDGLEQLPNDFERVIVAVSPDTRSDEAYKKAYPDVVRNLSARLPEARILLVSSTTVYGQEGGDEISDESQTSDATFSAARILEAENLALDRAPTGVVIRASGIYGPERIATISKLAHVELTAGDRGLWTNRIHRDDLARILVHLAEAPEARGIYLATDPNPATLGEIQDFVRTHPNRRRLPPPQSARRTRSRKSRRMYPKRLLSGGFSFMYPSFRDGYAPILDALSEA